MSLQPRRVNFDEKWALLYNGFVQIFSQGGSALVNGSEMMSDVYSLCTAYPKPFAEKLYDEINKFLVQHVAEVRGKILESSDILSTYLKYYSHYSLASTSLSIICRYMNNLVTNNSKNAGSQAQAARHASRSMAIRDAEHRTKLSVEAMAMNIWKTEILIKVQKEYGNSIMHHVFLQIERDRNGIFDSNTVHASVVSEVILSLVLVNQHCKNVHEVYTDLFEKPFLNITKDYYALEASRFISDNNIYVYMEKVVSRLEEEILRSKRFCVGEKDSCRKVVIECENQLINAHRHRFYPEFEHMIAQERLEVHGGIAPILELFEKFVTALGKSEVQKLGSAAAKDPRLYVETLIGIFTKYMRLVSLAFNRDALFEAAVDKAFRSIINDSTLSTEAQSSELLAKYCDFLLKKNPKNAFSEAEFEEKLNQVVVLFKYVDDKDVFQKFYSRTLAKRLIYSSSVSDEAESNMISKLKTACGYEYTTKLQRMFTDMTVSTDINSNFKEYISRHSAQLGAEFSIMVLTAGSWPLTQTSQTGFQVPIELERCVAQFETFYHGQHNGRKLSWLYHLSKGDVKMNFLKRRYELQVTVYQMAVLLLFNSLALDTDALTLKDIRDGTSLPASELTRVVRSLVESKLINASSNEYKDDTSLTLNLQFSNKRTKIKISAPMQADTPQETASTHQAIDEDRKLYLQAAIVRIMKTHITMAHNQLIQEVIDQSKSRFHPSVAMIKKCIEYLIEKQYIERSETSREKYNYVA